MALSAAQAEALVDQLEDDAATLHAIVHGAADAVVPTEGGNVKSAAKAIADMEAAFAAALDDATGAVGAAVGKAEEWAEKPEDEEVEAGKFSALHWAAKAQEALDSMTNVLWLKGEFDASGGSYPADPDIGDYWIVTVDGTIGADDLFAGDEIVYGPSGWIVQGRNQSANEILTKIKTVDGPGSGLDADLLDGQQGAYYAVAAVVAAALAEKAAADDVATALALKADIFTRFMGFSAGEAPEETADLNAITGNRLMYFASTAANRPAGMSWGYVLQFQRGLAGGAADRKTQIVCDALEGPPRLVLRQLYDSNWTERELVNLDDIVAALDDKADQADLVTGLNGKISDPGSNGLVLRSGPDGAAQAIGYSSGTLTPTVTFFMAGDLSVTYHSRSVNWQRVGNRVSVDFSIDFTPTFTTSSGPLWITTLPVAAANSISGGMLSEFSGNPSTGPSLPAGRTWVTPRVSGGLTVIELLAHGAGTTSSKLNPSNFVSGNRYVISGSITYTV